MLAVMKDFKLSASRVCRELLLFKVFSQSVSLLLSCMVVGDGI